MKVGVRCSQGDMLWSCIVWYKIDGVSIPMSDKGKILYNL